MSIRKLQLGAEGTAGTAVPATTIYRAPASDIKIDDTKVMPPENVGYYPKLGRQYTPAKAASYAMPEHEATFEQIGYIYNAGIKSVAGAADGGGSGYIYAYPLATTAENTLQTYTLEARNTTEPIEMEYGFVSEFSLSGTPGEAWKLTATWKGRQATTGISYTTGLTIPTVEELLFGKSKLYLDAVTGNVGGTQKTGTFLGATINCVTGWDYLYTGDGNLYFTRAKFFPELQALTGSITFEFDGTATAEEAFFNANTPRLMRILTEGSTLGTAGTAYSKKSHIIDCALVWTGFSELENRNGNDVVTLDFEAVYNSDEDLFAEITVVNALSALP